MVGHASVQVDLVWVEGTLEFLTELLLKETQSLYNFILSVLFISPKTPLLSPYIHVRIAFLIP